MSAEVDDSEGSGFWGKSEIDDDDRVLEELNMLDKRIVWTNDDYQLRADELELHADMINSISATLRRPAICLPWFAISDLFEQDKSRGTSRGIPAGMIVSDLDVRSRYFSMTYDEKRVSDQSSTILISDA